MQSFFMDRNEGFQTHYLQWQPKTKSNRLPVICIHGSLSNARTFKWIGEELSSEHNINSRQVISIDLRGCGESGMPQKGFTLQQMSSDIEAVMKHLEITEAHFISYSRGVAYALQYALLHPRSIHGLIIGDYQSYYPKLTEAWANEVMVSYESYESWDHLFAALTVTENISREEFDARKEDFYIEKAGLIQKRYSKELPIRMQLESENYDLSSALDHIQGQLLILKGNEEGSLLNDDQLKVYEQYNPLVVRVAQAGHDVFEPRKQVKDALMDYFDKAI